MEYTTSKEHSGSYKSIDLLERLAAHSEPARSVSMSYGTTWADLYHRGSERFQSHEEAVDYLDALIDWAQQCKAALIDLDSGEAVPASAPDELFIDPVKLQQATEDSAALRARLLSAGDDDEPWYDSNDEDDDQAPTCSACGGDDIAIDDTAELPSVGDDVLMEDEIAALRMAYENTAFYLSESDLPGVSRDTLDHLVVLQLMGVFEDEDGDYYYILAEGISKVLSLPPVTSPRG